jgi:hypothetical protein
VLIREWISPANASAITGGRGVDDKKDRARRAPAPPTDELIRLGFEKATDCAIFTMDPNGIVTRLVAIRLPAHPTGSPTCAMCRRSTWC